MNVKGVQSFIEIFCPRTGEFELIVEGGKDEEIAEHIYKHRVALMKSVGQVVVDVKGTMGLYKTERFSRPYNRLPENWYIGREL